MTPRISIRLLFALCALSALLIGAAVADAGSRDRNNDKIPDRWEKRHKLSLKVNQAKRDQDRDNVSNLCEYQAETKPRKKDSDRDGRKDGREDSDGDGLKNSEESELRTDCGSDDSDDDGVKDGKEYLGEIVSYEDGLLTIAWSDGGEYTAEVTPETVIECDDGASDDPSKSGARASIHPPDEPPSDDGEGGEDDGKQKPDEPEDDYALCGEEELLAGAYVREIEKYDGVISRIVVTR